MTTMILLDRWAAAEFLHANSPAKKSAKKWYGFLKTNLRNPQLGYRIQAHILDGKPTYTEQALLEFIRATTDNSGKYRGA